MMKKEKEWTMLIEMDNGSTVRFKTKDECWEFNFLKVAKDLDLMTFSFMDGSFSFKPDSVVKIEKIGVIGKDWLNMEGRK